MSREKPPQPGNISSFEEQIAGLKSRMQQLRGEAADFAAAGDKDARFDANDAELLQSQIHRLEAARSYGITPEQYAGSDQIRSALDKLFEHQEQLQSWQANPRADDYRDTMIRKYKEYIQKDEETIRRLLG